MTERDDKVGMSIIDKEFLNIMERDMFRHPCANLVAPLPFRTPRTKLFNNRLQVVKRAQLLDTSLRKREHFLSFMKGKFENRHTELAPP